MKGMKSRWIFFFVLMERFGGFGILSDGMQGGSKPSVLRSGLLVFFFLFGKSSMSVCLFVYCKYSKFLGDCSANLMLFPSSIQPHHPLNPS